MRNQHFLFEYRVRVHSWTLFAERLRCGGMRHDFEAHYTSSGACDTNSPTEYTRALTPPPPLPRHCKITLHHLTTTATLATLGTSMKLSVRISECNVHSGRHESGDNSELISC
jgi:hypothetical protein